MNTEGPTIQNALIMVAGREITLSTFWLEDRLFKIEMSLADNINPNVDSKLSDIFQTLVDGQEDAIKDLDHEACGTAFQQRVWAAASQIPYGSTASYQEIAEAAGCRSPRAVGQALGANPLPLVIPCHRVIGSDGKLTGFSAGIELKELLLRHENENCSGK